MPHEQRATLTFSLTLCRYGVPHLRYEQVVRPGRHEDSWGAGCALRSYHKLCPIHPLARTHQLLSAVLLHTFVILTSVFFEAEVCALTATAISLMPKAAPTFSPSHPHPHTLTLTPSPSHPHPHLHAVVPWLAARIALARHEPSARRT